MYNFKFLHTGDVNLQFPLLIAKFYKLSSKVYFVDAFSTLLIKLGINLVFLFLLYIIEISRSERNDSISFDHNFILK